MYLARLSIETHLTSLQLVKSFLWGAPQRGACGHSICGWISQSVPTKPHALNFNSIVTVLIRPFVAMAESGDWPAMRKFIPRPGAASSRHTVVVTVHLEIYDTELTAY